MYKDKDRQREANRQASQRRRDKGMTQGMTKGVTEGMTQVMADKGRILVVTDAEHARLKRGKDREPYQNMNQAWLLSRHLGKGKRGKDTITAKVFECSDKQGKVHYPQSPKRGKGIKVFGDLPMDVQREINMMIAMSGDETEHKRRTAIAINYQHQFPDRYHSTGT